MNPIPNPDPNSADILSKLSQEKLGRTWYRLSQPQRDLRGATGHSVIANNWMSATAFGPNPRGAAARAASAKTPLLRAAASAKTPLLLCCEGCRITESPAGLGLRLLYLH